MEQDQILQFNKIISIITIVIIYIFCIAFIIYKIRKNRRHKKIEIAQLPVKTNTKNKRESN